MTLPSDKGERLLSAPLSVWEKIDAAIKFYASMESYLPPRTGGVLEGCTRSGTAPIFEDRGRAASDVLMELVKLYPLAETTPSHALQNAPAGSASVLIPEGTQDERIDAAVDASQNAAPQAIAGAGQLRAAEVGPVGGGMSKRWGDLELALLARGQFEGNAEGALLEMEFRVRKFLNAAPAEPASAAPTPRTDAAVAEYERRIRERYVSDPATCIRDTAEKLERELAEAKDDYLRPHREKLGALFGPDGFPRSAPSTTPQIASHLADAEVGHMYRDWKERFHPSGAVHLPDAYLAGFRKAEQRKFAASTTPRNGAALESAIEYAMRKCPENLSDFTDDIREHFNRADGTTKEKTNG